MLHCELFAHLLNVYTKKCSEICFQVEKNANEMKSENKKTVLAFVS